MPELSQLILSSRFLTEPTLRGRDSCRTDLENADLSGALLRQTTFDACDLTGVKSASEGISGNAISQTQI